MQNEGQREFQVHSLTTVTVDIRQLQHTKHCTRAVLLLEYGKLFKQNMENHKCLHVLHRFVKANYVSPNTTLVDSEMHGSV